MYARVQPDTLWISAKSVCRIHVLFRSHPHPHSSGEMCVNAIKISFTRTDENHNQMATCSLHTTSAYTNSNLAHCIPNQDKMNLNMSFITQNCTKHLEKQTKKKIYGYERMREEEEGNRTRVQTIQFSLLVLRSLRNCAKHSIGFGWFVMDLIAKSNHAYGHVWMKFDVVLCACGVAASCAREPARS